ncbi:nitrate- and nitrite sensing domain-containing protein [Actinosynnema sp. NPDC047251]|uniref:histidine kinase n=1 Tax=Saccharothrix espanaensis (strain ATCC 51144 / DSM 44229 / JCM 9112 / NBRC 15066 / NRRL 15764) TaxID=1179773 RepID=K0JZS6_SACES|nr:nitrate- and nitrite sensing domain-containing protein [Saccharothrix espanaensis]CCH33495.1 Sensor protein with HAMP domain [Saccharothrix espanaensis DSM 44229]
MTGDNSARWPWWGAVADWRNWRLPVKLAAVLAVPVIVAIGAGMVQIRGYVRAADGYSAAQRMVTLRAGLDPLIANIQAERAVAARGVEATSVEQRRFKELLRNTDAAVAGVRNLLERTASSLGPVATARFDDVNVQLDGLPQLRDRVLARTIEPAGAIGGYTVVLRALLDFDQAMVGDFGDPALAGTANALHNLAMAAEQISWQHATVLSGVRTGVLPETERNSLEQSWTRQQDKIADFTAVATPQQQADFRSAVAGETVASRDALLQQVRVDPEGLRRIDAEVWDDGSTVTAKQYDRVLRGLEDQLKASAARLQDETSDRAGFASAILLASLFAAVAVGFVVGSYLLRSLRALRVAALDVAQHRLPTLVAQLREDTAPEVTIDPVPVHTREEFGQLARAFDAVHRQAVSSATEQAELRTGMRNAFINLSRRSQSLVERQLRLMEELERREEQPEQLSGLFKLDNLATRMRRNNENLMVLSGSDMARRFTRPVPLGDVLRASASEIEQYQRVVVQATPPVEVVGYAAGDVVRLIAELMDNATTFSPPRTQVVVGGRGRPGGGVLVDVVDVGVGMSEDDLVEANAKIARAAADEEAGDLPVSRQLGLYVVGRLAGRHGIQVALREQGEGVRAVVALPAELVRVVQPTAARPVPAQPGAPRHAAPETTPAGPTAATDPTTPAAATNGTPARDEKWASFRGRTAEPAPTGPTAFGTTVTPATPAPPVRAGALFTKPVPASAPGTAAPAPPDTAGGPRPGSTWFGRSRVPGGNGEPPRHNGVEHSGHVEVPGQGDPPVQENSAGLPKRRPRSNLAAERPSAPDAAAPVRRDPNATRGFLASYQTGVRQGVHDSGENRTGRESTT